jgi:hypothetical protein
MFIHKHISSCYIRTHYNELVDDCPAVGSKADELS